VNELLDAITRIDTRVVLVVALLVLDIWAIGMTLASDASRKENPIFGCLFWFSLGPKPDLIGTGPSGERSAAD
jgi:hypothetical protein